MSLWSVPDRATSILMDQLYGHLLKRRRALGPHHALREAQLHLLRSSRETLGDPRPQDWAGFVVSGLPDP